MPHLQCDDDPFKHLHIQRELVCEFMAVFSRLEYAIKATPGYAGGNEKWAEALWDRFANDVNDAFCSVPIDETEFWEAVNGSGALAALGQDLRLSPKGETQVPIWK